MKSTRLQTYSDECIPNATGTVTIPLELCNLTRHTRLGNIYTYVDNSADLLQWSESDDLLEEVEEVISRGRMREVRDGCAARPRNNGDKEDAYEDRATDAVEHEEHGQDTADEDT